MLDFSQIEHRVWAEVDLDNLVYNYRQVCAAAPGSEVLCVVKADAYGHGAVPAARALAAAGCGRFGVATAEEALQLRRHRVVEPILLLGAVPARWAPRLARQNITMAVPTLADARAYAERLDGAKLRVHIKVDTGMRRIGLWVDEAVEEALAIAAVPGLEVEGIFTHFCAADDGAEDDFTALQLARFLKVCEALAERGLHIPLRHCANSAGIIAHPASHLDMVRPGIMLYGSNPRDGAAFPLRAPLSLRSRIVQVKPVEKGESVGYGRTWYAPATATIATVGVGYADGLLRNLSNSIDMLVCGRRAPQRGRICMDMCMLELGDIPGAAGGVATLIGTDGDERLTADEMAAACGTISYEVLCAVGRRVPRLYVQGGKLVDEACYVDQL